MVGGVLAPHVEIPMSESGGPQELEDASAHLDQYRLRGILGNGSFGKVRLAEHVITQLQVAVKILDVTDLRRRNLDAKVRKEMQILGCLVHPHIIRLYELIETGQRWYAVMEYAEGGELFDYLIQTGRLEEHRARRLFQQLLSAVEYCHINKIVHRDLKPENILLDRNLNVKVADFGLSNHIRDGQFLKTSCGSPNYAAPEVISGKMYSGPEVDIWSCGVILYAMLANCLPFDSGNISELFKSIQTAAYKVPDHLSIGAQDLISRMLTVDPIKRITIPEIKQHPWFCEAPYFAVNMNRSGLDIDLAVVDAVGGLGFDRQYILSSLRQGARNVATVTYLLMLDKKNQMLPNGAVADLHICNFSTPDGSWNSDVGMQPRIPCINRWELGCSVDKTPSSAMEDIVQALSAHGICFKRPGPYTLHCRKVIEGLEAATNPHRVAAGQHIPDTAKELKFEVQLYKNSRGSMFVDIQRLAGDVMSFLYCSSSLLSCLRAH